MEKLYHIGFTESPGARYAILPGDPGRVAEIASYLDNARFYCQNREYTSWLGEISGEKVLVMSTGMGGPSAAIALEELYMADVRVAVRVGTCGGMQTDVLAGDLVIANAAIRMEGTSREYAPIEFPAVSDFDVTSALRRAAGRLGCPAHVGVVQSKDSFYGQHDPDRMPVGAQLRQKWEAWIKAGALASEMESAALFVVGQTLRMQVGSVLSVVWNQERARLGLDSSEAHDSSAAIQTAVGAIAEMIDGEK